MSKKRILILIPARFASTRFPGKPLAEISGKSMIRRVLENCLNAFHLDLNFEAYVVTDDQRIEDHVKQFSPNVVRVDDDVISGTLRIELAYQRFFKNENYDLVVNVQGDEPLLESSELVNLANYHLSGTFDITTLVKKQLGFGMDFLDPNRVKVVHDEKTGRTLYFSRAPVPFKRESSTNDQLDYWFLHIGVYSYRPSALTQFAKASESRLENLEKLEQLRALELGLSIGALNTQRAVIGVDSPEDIKKVEEVLNVRE